MRLRASRRVASVSPDEGVPGATHVPEEVVDGQTRRRALITFGGAATLVGAAVVGGEIRHRGDVTWMAAQWQEVISGAEAHGRAQAIMAEQDATLRAAGEAQRLVSTLNASGGASRVEASLLNATVHFDTKDGPASVRYPFLLSSYGGPGTTWLGYQQTMEGNIALGFVPIRDDTVIDIDQARPIFAAQLYTAPVSKGGPGEAWPMVYGLTMDEAPLESVAILHYQS